MLLYLETEASIDQQRRRLGYLAVKTYPTPMPMPRSSSRVQNQNRSRRPPHHTNIPQNSALPPAPSSASHCTKKRSTIRRRILPLRLSVLTLAKLSTYIVLHLPLLFARLQFANRNSRLARIMITAVAGPFVMMRSGRSAAARSYGVAGA